MPRSRRVRGYVLAGGRSSRMGTDKAEVLFAGRTMLAAAVATMRSVCDEVVVIGTREHVPPPASCVADRFPECGPMGGIEAALGDCEEHGAELAVFLPVDTPLLPGGLLGALVELWTESESVRAAVSVADGRVQPLISMLHVELLPAFREALGRGNLKLQPELRAAAASVAERSGLEVDAVLFATTVAFRGDRRVMAGDAELGWVPTEEEWACRSAWFANLNTPLELQRASEAAEHRTREAAGR